MIDVRRALPLLAGALVAATACVHRPGAAGGTVGAQSADSTVQLFVTNHYALPVEIYAQGAGTSYLMGTVLPGLEGHFLLRKAMLATGGMIEFLAVPADNVRTVRSGQLQLVPGDIVDFEIATHLLGSVATIRP